MALMIATANRLHDGDVVYLTEEGRWSEDLQDAWTADETERQADLEAKGLADEKALVIVGAYLMPVNRREDRLVPTSQREVIRALGPTIRTDLGKQAA